MKIPFDFNRQIHLEHDNYTVEIIKQADVVLLGYPLQYPMSSEIRENDLNYYSSVTSRNGPAMTWSVTSIGYNEILHQRKMEFYCKSRNSFTQTEEIELKQKADFYFYHSYQNAQAPYYIWTETPLGVCYLLF